MKPQAVQRPIHFRAQSRPRVQSPLVFRYRSRVPWRRSGRKPRSGRRPKKPKSSSVCLIELAQFRPERGDIMCEEREKVRCRSCELVQWGDRANCRRCGKTLPEPLMKVVEKVVIRYAPECLQSLEEARR